MRECPVCEAIVLLDQDRCSICDHDLSAPAPEDLSEAVAPPIAAPRAAPKGLDEDDDVEPDEPSRVREGSIIIGLVFFVAAAALIGWFVQQDDPLDDTATGDAVVAGDAVEIERARAMCTGVGEPVAGAPSYSSAPGVHPAGLVLGELGQNDVDTTISLFPAEWIVDLSQRPLDVTELLLCVSRTSGEAVDSTCPAGADPDGLVRLEATYRIRVFETATADQLADAPVASNPYGPCPDPASTDAATVYPEPSPVDLVNVVVPLVLIDG